MFDDSFLGRPDTLWHPFTPMPPVGPREVLARAEGAFVYTESGHKLFDATSSWWCQSLGHCHPRLVKAFTDQAKVMDQVMVAPHTHRPAIELGDKLLGALGEPFRRLFYSDDGSTAVEAALKMSLQFQKNVGQPKRRRFMALERGYHGDTLGAVAVSHVGEFHDLLPFESHVFRARVPSRADDEAACLSEVENFLKNEGDTVAALIAEPLVLGAAGMHVYSLSYLEKLVRLVRNAGALVIFDEVFTGFGRTGPLFALETMPRDLRPDMVCLSKGLTSGFLPFAVTAVTKTVYDAFTGGPAKAFFHGHTFTANPMACRVALEVLRIFEEEKIVEKNRVLIEQMAAQKARFLALPNVAEVRHLGMVWAVELKDAATGQPPVPANGPGWRIASACWNKGLWLRPLHQNLYLTPPYCATPEDLSRAFDVLLSAVQKES